MLGPITLPAMIVATPFSAVGMLVVGTGNTGVKSQVRFDPSSSLNIRPDPLICVYVCVHNVYYPACHTILCQCYTMLPNVTVKLICGICEVTLLTSDRLTVEVSLSSNT